MAHLHCNILGGKNYRAKKARLAKNKSRVFLFGFHHRPYPNFVSYNLQVISFKKEHKRYGIGKLFHLVSDNEQEKTMLAKVDQVLSQPTSQPPATTHGKKFLPTSPVVHSGEPEDENALASYTSDNLLSP